MARKKIVVVDPKKMKWEPIEDPGCDKRVWAKLLWTDKKTGAVAVLAKLPKGLHEARHKHPSDAHVLVLEGKLVDEKGNEIKKGMYWFVPGVWSTAIDRSCARRLCCLHILQWSSAVAAKKSYRTRNSSFFLSIDRGL